MIRHISSTSVLQIISKKFTERSRKIRMELKGGISYGIITPVLSKDFKNLST